MLGAWTPGEQEHFACGEITLPWNPKGNIRTFSGSERDPAAHKPLFFVPLWNVELLLKFVVRCSVLGDVHMCNDACRVLQYALAL